MRKVEFGDAVKQAVERNPTMADATAAIAQAQALLDQARATTRPTVNASLTNVTLDSARGFSGGVTQPQNQFSFSGTATLPLIEPTTWAVVNQARDQVRVATETAAEARRQTALAAARAYLAVVTAERQVEVDQRALDSARAHLDYAQKRLEGGAGSRLNQVRAAQAVTNDEARLENTKLALRRAQEALGVLMAEDGPVDASGVPSFDVPPPAADAEAAASRPDLRAQAATVDAARRVLNDAWKVLLPSAAVSFTPQYITPAGLFQPSKTWRLVFTISQDLFDARPKTERALRTVLLQRAQYAQTAAEIQARSEIRVAREAAASNERALASARLSADQANDVVRISTAAFEVGATTNLEVIDAQRSARDAETDATSAEDGVRRAQLELLVALGRFPQ
jgi:outer membrane protein TolC